MRIWPAPIEVRSSPAGAPWVVRVRRPGDRRTSVGAGFGKPDASRGVFNWGDGGHGIDGFLAGLFVVLAAVVLLLIAWYILIPLLLLLGELLILVIIGAIAAVAARIVRLPLVVEAVGSDERRITVPARGLRDAERKAVDLADRIALNATLPDSST